MPKHITQNDIIYFIVTDRFFGRNKINAETSDNKIHGGTLDGIIEKLDYLLELGITAIWITPVYQNITEFFGSEPYHYYWASDFEKIDERLLDGTQLPNSTEKETLAEFVGICRSKGLKVILDMVVNHAGYGAEVNFDPSWFNKNGSGDIKGELAGLPDFNHDNPQVLDYFINNIRNWKKQGKISNIRMDTVKHVEPKFWHFFKYQLRGEFPDITLIGEVLCEGKDDVEQLLQYQNYHDFDSIFDFPLCTAMRAVFIYDESVSEWLARPRLSNDEPSGILDDDNPLKGGYRNANALVTLLDNHDLEKRILSHARSKHTGEGEGLAWAIRVTKLCYGLMFTVRGIPQLYYGTELGLEGWKQNNSDADMRRDFPWEIVGADNLPLASFTTASEIYEWVKDLIKLRKRSEALQFGTMITLWSDRFVYAFLRIATTEVSFVILNNGYLPMPQPIQIPINTALVPSRIITMLSSLKHWQSEDDLVVNEGFITITVDAKAIDIFI